MRRQSGESPAYAAYAVPVVPVVPVGTPGPEQSRQAVRSQEMQLLRLPKASENMDGGTVARWLISEGDQVKRGQALVDIQTEKADFTLEADQDGSVARILARAKAAAERGPDPVCRARMAFLQEGLNHARTCVETARVMNNPRATTAERAAALDRLIAYRRGVERLGIANLDRLAQIETESWKDVPGFTAPASTLK